MKRVSRDLSLVGATAIALLTGCGPGGDVDTPAGAVAALGVQNVAEPVPNLITAAQPTRAQADALVSMGYENFISLQFADESGAGWEEAGIPGAGGRFARIPVGGPDDLTRENVEALAQILDEVGGEQTVLYCASSNRVGALLALKAYWMDGADADDALALGRAAGMRSLEPNVRRLLEEGR